VSWGGGVLSTEQRLLVFLPASARLSLSMGGQFSLQLGVCERIAPPPTPLTVLSLTWDRHRPAKGFYSQCNPPEVPPPPSIFFSLLGGGVKLNPSAGWKHTVNRPSALRLKIKWLKRERQPRAASCLSREPAVTPAAGLSNHNYSVFNYNRSHLIVTPGWEHWDLSAPSESNLIRLDKSKSHLRTSLV